MDYRHGSRQMMLVVVAKSSSTTRREKLPLVVARLLVELRLNSEPIGDGEWYAVRGRIPQEQRLDAAVWASTALTSRQGPSRTRGKW